MDVGEAIRRTFCGNLPDNILRDALSLGNDDGMAQTATVGCEPVRYSFESVVGGNEVDPGTPMAASTPDVDSSAPALSDRSDDDTKNISMPMPTGTSAIHAYSRLSFNFLSGGNNRDG